MYNFFYKKTVYKMLVQVLIIIWYSDTWEYYKIKIKFEIWVYRVITDKYQ